MDSSAAPRAALAAATERPSDVSAAIVEWGTVPQTPTAITTSGSKVHVCGSCAPGTRRATEAHGLRMSHGPYLACLRPTATPRLASSATVNFDGNDCAPVVVEAVQVGAERAVSVVVVVSNRGGTELSLPGC